ncbi:hypothetical protein AXA84_0258 [Candidatus Phytoplasma oryzae]|uniref:Uncharacterized protein n=1 Tax=Candidatus Phytoplasma oryzae TaxID=203274 RepID=A0A139JQI4_9MOLU|nr:hypothetical protein [Candidatus Phytoplasma oryzae]KXT29229.1 hypothetical protein AXA84_0258 [Candidatus Phytoplasma oryzae]
MKINEIKTIYIQHQKEIWSFLTKHCLMKITKKEQKLAQMTLLLKKKNFHCRSETNLEAIYIRTTNRPIVKYNYSGFVDLEDLINTHLNLFKKKKVYFFRKKA